MEIYTEYFIKFSIVILLVLANAFFVAAEFALVSVRKSRVEALVKEGMRSAEVLLKAINSLDHYIAGTQLGITLASLALGWVGEKTLEHLLSEVFYFLPPILTSFGLPMMIAFFTITFLHVVLGELVPKSLALQYPEKTALYVATPMRITVGFLRPMIWMLNTLGNYILKLMGLQSSGDGHGNMVHSVEELQILVEHSHQQGVLDEMERFMLQRVFKIKNMVAKNVMVHRLDVVGMPVEMPLEGLMLAIVDAPYSRFPVYDGDLDHVIGILFVKDLIGYRKVSPLDFDLKKILRPALFVPENAAIETLLAQFKKAHTQMAIVMDEFGGTSGLVTLEDVVEELLGELNQIDGGEIKEEIPQLRRQIVVDGKTRLDALNEKYALNIINDDVDTIAGFVTNYLGRLPQKGEEIVLDNIVIKVRDTDGPRLTLLSIAPKEHVDKDLTKESK